MGSRQSEDCVGLNCTSTANRVWYCIDCDSFLCDPCWSQYPPHTGDRKGRDGLEHERTKYNVYVQLRHILNPKYTRDELENLHYRDLDTTWFGIRRTEDGRPSFADHDVYSTLMEEPLSSGAEKHPQLASFIGQTNAGKSTLIKMLIQLQERRHNIETPLFPTPVVGSSTQTHNPTSADVHLYVDPRRCERSTPLLYADCEGFNAGATLPLGAIENRTSVHDGQTLLPRLTPGRTRPLTWADTDEKKTRAFAVAQLYPRILYTFSDVIVFVLRDSRTFEVTTLRPLLEWGEASLETSVNQPTLPHAIIALNSTDLDGPINEWSSETATQNLLDANQGCLHPVNGHPFFLRLAKQWRARNRRKPIKRIIDLIHCYYSTFKVIRIPYKGRYQLLNNQIQGLHKMITESCDTSFAAKREVNMLSNSAELNVYFQSAFEHFTKTLDTPFNFREVSLLNNPIADDFGGHILQLALAIQSHGRRTDCEMIFDNLRYPVASSVMLDCIRHRKGLPEDLFTAYEDKCRDALEEFGDLHAPCEYHTDTEICVNVATNHSSKGHQNAAGKIIKPGRFRSRFKPDQYYPTWSARIREAIRDIHQHLQATLEGEQGVSEETCLLRIHSDVMDRLYAITGSASDFLSHSTCFCCLMQAPQHILPCGHVLCANCVRSYGKTLIGGTTTKSVLCLSCCPLHPGVTQWQPPFIVRFKPDQAGVRLLSLDGGGIRGIVELEVLRAIQRQFSDRIPIRAFFDLIIGTSTGGIIALAMGVKDWRMKRCIEDFIHLCGIAFTPRPMHDVPILKYLIPFRHVAKYETSPLRTVLKNTFGEQRLFGGDQSQCPDHGAKVAVVAADEAGRRAIVLANYSRKDSNDTGERTVSYEFLRRANPKLELKVWEAAAATSATPSYFKPFEHEPTRKTYLDGNVYHNNPISILHHESKLLWPDVADRSPDILLSIGTSQNAAVLTESLSSNSLPSQSGQHVFSSELAWKHFRAHVNSADELGRNESRYMRINPDIGREPPGLDEINRLKELQRDVRHALKSRENRSQIERVAHVLVASSFYYERTSAARFERNGYFSCTGNYCACSIFEYRTYS
ncbi:acyl transferase/acyl hydrolase/lysophospholipase [Pyrenochaeta sp. MPI-SDFR-AT-0127]|nr:acyl transferase/acyl hydrolase/lysophospholipase [Pyrenochaeta sp. MPI-SDFR-AT-0127]